MVVNITGGMLEVCWSNTLHIHAREELFSLQRYDTKREKPEKLTKKNLWKFFSK